MNIVDLQRAPKPVVIAALLVISPPLTLLTVKINLPFHPLDDVSDSAFDCCAWTASTRPDLTVHARRCNHFEFFSLAGVGFDCSLVSLGQKSLCIGDFDLIQYQ